MRTQTKAQAMLYGLLAADRAKDPGPEDVPTAQYMYDTLGYTWDLKPGTSPQRPKPTNK